MIRLVTEGIYRGPRPFYMKYLLSYGIKTILNLEDDKVAVENERKLASAVGINFINLPMSEIKRPTTQQLLISVDCMDTKSFHPIFVHCLHGQDRTGYVVAAYRMLVQGWTYEAAYHETKDNGHKWWFAPYLLLWPRSLKELEK